MTELSIVCPVLNESNYISSLLDTLLFEEEISKEVILVDGGSGDGTLAIIQERMKTDSRIKLVHNPKRYVSHGFNLAYPQCSGNFIAFVGAHALYPMHYFSKAVACLKRDEADAVGGPLIQTAKGEKGRGIAFAMSCSFGVGGTEFRTLSEKRYVQSVAFAVYKKSVFERAGLLDEQLIRNQDDEFHYRINALGMKILMLPELSCTYFVRESFKDLFRQYYQYGYYKPLVLKKVNSGLRLRHLIPAFFTFYLLSLPIAFFLTLWLIPLALYLMAALYFSQKKQNGNRGGVYAFLSFPVLHISYGLGFLNGLFLSKN